MIQKSKIKKSWYASSGLNKEEFLERALKKHAERQKNHADYNMRNQDITEAHYNMCLEVLADIRQNSRTASDAAHNASPSIYINNSICIGVEGNTEYMYSKKYGFPGTRYHNYIHLPLYFTPAPQHLQWMDGLYNLYCNVISNDGRTIVYKSKWIVQGRGFNIHAKNGYIGWAPETNTYFHAETAKKARQGVLTKSAIQSQKSSPKSFADWKSTDYISRKKFGELTGACMSGIENFCARAGIEKSVNRMMVKDIIPLLQIHAADYYELVKKHAPQLF